MHFYQPHSSLRLHRNRFATADNFPKFIHTNIYACLCVKVNNTQNTINKDLTHFRERKNDVIEKKYVTLVRLRLIV